MKIKLVPWALAVGVLSQNGTVFGMGNRPPNDPATYQDILNVQTQTQAEASRATQAEGNLSNQQSADEGRINQVDQTKVLAEGALRVLDTKRFAVELFDDYDARRTVNFALGAKVTLKLGKSYEQRLLEKQEREINALRALLVK